MSIQGPTDYQHPYPNYQLNDLHQAMDYNVTLTVAFTQTNTDLLYKLGWQELSG